MEPDDYSAEFGPARGVTPGYDTRHSILVRAYSARPIWILGLKLFIIVLEGGCQEVKRSIKGR